MKATHWISLAVACAIGAAACGDGDGDEASTPVSTTIAAPLATAAPATAPPATAAPATAAPGTMDAPVATATPADRPAADVLFTDSFDDDRNGWGEIEDGEYGTLAFADGDYVWESTGSVTHWLPAVLGEQYDRGELQMHDVIVRADITVDRGDGVAGVFCRETPDTDAEWQWYEFVARDGYAAIRRADLEANLDVLAETDDVSLPAGAPFTIEGVCIDDAAGTAQLSMSIDDQVVLEASDDDPLGNGVVGLQLWTYPIHAQMDVRWHAFSVVSGT